VAQTTATHCLLVVSSPFPFHLHFLLQRPKSNYLGKVLIKRLNKSSSPGFFFKNEVTAGALFLITKDADVTVAVEHGRTALHNAAYKGHAACIDPLVKAGAELEAKGCRGSTPLILAAGSGHADCIGLLLKAGAELKAKDEVSRVAFRWFVVVGCLIVSSSIVSELAPLVLSLSLSLSFFFLFFFLNVGA